MGLDQGGTRPDEHGATKDTRRTGPSPAAFAGAGVELAGLILLGLYAGQWVDKRLGTAPWLLILGVFAGAAAGFYNMYRILTTADRRAKSHAKR